MTHLYLQTSHPCQSALIEGRQRRKPNTLLLAGLIGVMIASVLGILIG